jgi:PilZ domain
MSKIRPRHHDRERVLRDVTFRVLPAGYTWRGSTIDLSPSGAKLFSEQALQVGDLLELAWPGGNPALKLTGRVAHVHVEVDGTWAGVQFVAPIDSKAFESLCAERGRPTRGD